MSDIKKVRSESANVQGMSNLQGEVDSNQTERAQVKIVAEEKSPRFQKLLESEENQTKDELSAREKSKAMPKGPLDLFSGARRGSVEQDVKQGRQQRARAERDDEPPLEE